MDGIELRAELERCHAESYGWALSCCSRDPAEAADVLQTVYLKILEGKARYSGKAAFRTWLFAVIRKTAADARRRRTLRQLGLRAYGKRAHAVPREENPDEQIYRTQIRAMFLRALTALPRRQREVVQLVFYHDLSLQEAAAVMGVSVGSARTHYARAKKRLRQRLEASGEWHEPRVGREENPAAVS